MGKYQYFKTFDTFVPIDAKWRLLYETRSNGSVMSCCKCNRSGSCARCVCVKAKRPCTTCLPGKLGVCANSKNASPTVAPPIQAKAKDQAKANDLDHPMVSSGFTPLNTPSSSESETSQDSTQENLQGECECLSVSQFTQHITDLDNAWSFPTPADMSSPTFTWGSLDAQAFIAAISRAYDEVIHWRPNLFLVPFGNVGSRFIRELARLYRAFAEGSALECIALKAATVLTSLALQKPYKNSKAKTHMAFLERRLESWNSGGIAELLAEGQTIQKRSFRGQPKHSTQASTSSSELARSFSILMFQGKCSAALTLLTERKTARVLKEDDLLPSGESVYDALKSKHPSAQGLKNDALLPLESWPPLPSPVMFECIDAELIHHAAKNTTGTAGPSGLDAHGWRRICCTFKEASDELCLSLALLARRLCTQVVHHSALAPLLACRLIALDKNPGVRPIGRCEVSRRIISKTILYVIKDDIQDAAGSN